ncbi:MULTISPECIES: hypothetical protein [unclassified Cryobacterium]|uniref:hypothetical protein n=1 Tax=unclassified Cryobacterium TaxID=2649013 RepID=UPI00106A1B0F|nr:MULTISPECIES: hypothetical protein [unclassified Cryobacterium]TFC52297.1 hypothetical protein E3O68_14470 [Cryobacterium sp. TMB3-1-2]TFC59318.1 hypothetical protein E3O60_10025 [Cryobacterium sp. TMB1-7]TFC69793.1 hypothetical protein E3T21_11320 [Cryobacterium sp. TMB3-15]TFC79052.1 hypothetical protein E3T22_02110 [Cryobacterium sp. TMB3-10]TFC86714.1 hypothetical protein E3T19_14025 [Cryobacterium sp. TMT4-31]
MTDATQHARVPISRIVDEGLLIALSSVRMAVKNDIIVAGLAEHADYDLARFADSARREMLALSRENQESGERVRAQRKELTSSTWRYDLTQDQLMDLHKLKLRRKMHKLLALALVAVADDEDQVARLVRDAQHAASDELQDAMHTRLMRLSIDALDPEYQLRRAERTEMFVLVDLALLKLKADEAAGQGLSDY